MNCPVSWRLTVWALPIGIAALSGCAALDLLEGQLPGEEGELPFVETTPYPSSTTNSAQRPPLVEPASQAKGPAASAVAMVSVAETAQTPPVSAAPSPARATVQDGTSASATQNPLSPTSQPAATQPQAAAQPPAAADKAEIVPANTAPAPAPADKPAPANAAEEATSTPPETTVKSIPTAKPGGPAQAEPTAEQRLADVRRRRDELIAALQAEVKVRSEKEDPGAQLPRMQQQLRLLYLLAEKPDEAARQIESLPQAEQEAFRLVMSSLSVWLSPEEQRQTNLRNAEVLKSLRDAAVQLSAAVRLDVRNLHFCESVDGYGWYKEFPAAQFCSKQQVILYAEVDNFTTEQTGPESYETELQASYQIFDSGGTLVDERQLPLDKEVCRNQRRDYFLAYRIYLSDGLAAGRYRLELTVEDLKAKEPYQGRKFGESTVEFSIR